MYIRVNFSKWLGEAKEVAELYEFPRYCVWINNPESFRAARKMHLGLHT